LIPPSLSLSLSNVQLKGLEFTTHSPTARALADAASAMLGDEDVDAVLADAADAFSAGVALLEQTGAAACRAVYLYRL